jgi:hypothetical protein
VRVRRGHSDDSGDGRGATVTSVEPAGEERLVRVLPDGAAGDLLARLPWAAAPHTGDRVSLDWRPEDEHRFDAETGHRR